MEEGIFLSLWDDDVVVVVVVVVSASCVSACCDVLIKIAGIKVKLGVCELLTWTFF